MAQESMTDEEREMTKEREEALENEVIEALTVKGAENQEAKAVLVRWLEMGEAEAELLNTHEAKSKAKIEMAINVASVYHRAGYRDEALAELESTKEAAASENDGFELYNKIMELERKMRDETEDETG